MSTHIDGSQISAFLDGALTGAELSSAAAHVDACGACRRELESLRHMKLVLSSAPRRTLPADLALALEHRLVAGSSLWKTFVKPALWIPAGAVAAASLMVSLWMHQARSADEIPLEPLLAAHERYSAESLVSQDHLVASAYSDQLTSQLTALDADAADSELE
ncbi:MAG: anti-sigma factor family protein [Elusimicrobiota bacterium]